MDRRLDLNLLVTFEAIYRWRNLTTAGRQLGLSQPAMSHALARLRTLLEDPLFVRAPAGLLPTARANELSPELARGLALLRSALEHRPFDPAVSTRVFRVRMGDIAEVVHLPRLVRDASARAPGVRVQSVSLPEPEISTALAAGDIDLAAGNYDLGASCREMPLLTMEYACIARERHPALSRKMTLAAFRAARHVLVHPKGVGARADVVRKALAGRKVTATIATEVTSFYAAMSMVASTDLIATVPRQLAESMQSLARVEVFEPPFTLPRLKVSLYWHERFHRDPGHAWLRQTYAQLFRT